jgi:hypothetical protein
VLQARSRDAHTWFGDPSITESSNMAATRKGATQKRPPAGAGLDRAVKDFLKAVPIDHLDQRLTALEKWFARLEKEVRRSGIRVGRAAADTARIAVMGPRRAGTRTTRRPPAARRTH